MNSQWNALSLYHYSSTPTVNSPCSVCGLRPTATKSLYVKNKRFLSIFSIEILFVFRMHVQYYHHQDIY